MIEITHGGTTFRWSTLDVPSKWLAAATFACHGIAVTPLFWSIIATDLERGGPPPPDSSIEFSALVAFWLIGFVVLGGLAWWRFSLRQDEMFNRMQNWSLGMASGWSVALLTAWDTLVFANVLPPVGPWIIYAVFTFLWANFWMAAVKRWA